VIALFFLNRVELDVAWLNFQFSEVVEGILNSEESWIFENWKKNFILILNIVFHKPIQVQIVTDEGKYIPKVL
jgi:hypothetical protein